jgi:hypothetical protein
MDLFTQIEGLFALCIEGTDDENGRLGHVVDQSDDFDQPSIIVSGSGHQQARDMKSKSG